MPQPTMLDGMRAPRSVRLEEIRGAQEAETSVPAAAPGISVYVSRYRRYRVQITAPQSYIGPDGRKNSGGKRLEAQFEDGVFRNDAHDPKVRALIDESLQANKYFGAFGTMAHFWLANDQKARTEARKLQAALDTLKSLPRDVVEQHMAELRQGDADDHIFTPPAPAAEPASKAGIRPIPPTAA